MYYIHKIQIVEDTFGLFSLTRLIAVGTQAEMTLLRELFEQEFAINEVQNNPKVSPYSHTRIGNHQLATKHQAYSYDHRTDGIAIYNEERFVAWFITDGEDSGVFGVGVYTLLTQEVAFLRWLITQTPQKRKRSRK